MITSHVTFFAEGPARARIAAVNDSTVVYFSGLPGHVRSQDDLRRIDWRELLRKVGGLQATVQPADGRNVRLTVERYPAADYAPPPQALHITPGKSVDFVKLETGALTIGPIDHVIVPVDAPAGEELERFVKGMAWLPRDDAQAVLNTLRNPGLEWRVRRLEEVLAGTSVAGRWWRTGRAAVVSVLAAVALAAIAWGVIVWLRSNQAGQPNQSTSAAAGSADGTATVSAGAADTHKSTQDDRAVADRVVDVLILAAASKQSPVRDAALARTIAPDQQQKPSTTVLSVLRVILAAEIKPPSPKASLDRPLAETIGAAHHRQALQTYPHLVRYLFCSVPGLPVPQDAKGLDLDCNKSDTTGVIKNADALIKKVRDSTGVTPGSEKK